jgi:hypothetical protein
MPSLNVLKIIVTYIILMFWYVVVVWISPFLTQRGEKKVTYQYISFISLTTYEFNVMFSQYFVMHTLFSLEICFLDNTVTELSAIWIVCLNSHSWLQFVSFLIKLVVDTDSWEPCNITASSNMWTNSGF